ncbi:MAG: TonB-dependent receptor domain-containing protein [Mangrovibacterium sp.]
MRKSSRHTIGILVIFFAGIFPCFGQEETITIHADDKSLEQVLNDVASSGNFRFAFNADHFSKIRVNLRLESVSVNHFLDEICKSYHLLCELIDGTYVLYLNPAPLVPARQEKMILKGLVTDRSTGEPLLFCHIAFNDDQGTTTNELGIFAYNTNRSNELKVRISHLGYQKLDTVLNSTSDIFHQIRLKPVSFQMETIRVYQHEKDIIELTRESERIAFHPRQSAHLPRIDDSDLMTALSLIPGIHLLGGQAPGISIRGGSPAENLILLDGIPVLETSHLFGNMSVLNAKFVSQAFVSRGAFDATFGERVSGVVELTGQFNYLKPSLDLSANLMNVNAAGEVPLGKCASLSGAYRKSYIDQWENYLYRQILEQQTSSEEASSVIPAVHFDDFNLKFSVKPSDKQEVTINAFNSNDLHERDFLFRNARVFRDDQADSRNIGFSGNWKYQSGDNWQHRFNAGYNEVKRNASSVSGMEPNKQGKGGKKEINSDVNKLEEIRMDWSSELKANTFTHQFGAGVHIDQIDYHYLAETSTGNIRTDAIAYNRNLALLHVFGQEKIQASKYLLLRLGVRMNYENSGGKTFVQPRWGVNMKLTDDLSLFYSGGIYNQFLSSVRKTDSKGSADQIWYLPDSTGIGILKARQHVLGIRYDQNGLTLEAEAYSKRTRGKLNLYAEVSGSKEKTIEYAAREGESENFGLDILVHYRHGSLTHMLAWSLSKSNEKFEHFNNGEIYPAFDDQRQRIRWTEMLRHKSWIVAANLNCNSGSPYLVADDSPLNFERLPWFIQADLSLMKSLKCKSFTLSSGISLLNLFNRENVLEIDYFNVSDETGSYSFRTDLRAMKFTPVFFVNFRIN